MVVGKAVIRICPALILLALGFWLVSNSQSAYATTLQQSQSVGLEGTVPGPAPSTAPTVGVPTNGQSFSSIPITVTGLCQSGLLVEVFSNGVFVGSATCVNGSYSIQVDLFSGQNDLTVLQFDALNQSSPVSSTVTVTYNSGQLSGVSLVTITTQYAKRGADPGSVLSWPITISGGTAPYAVSVDWGDSTAPELISQPTAGNFNISHTYAEAGTYSVTVKVTDVNGSSAFLQLVGIGNGPIQQSTTSNSGKTTVITKKSIVLWPFGLSLVLSVAAFWLGKLQQLETIRARLRRGERPY